MSGTLAFSTDPAQNLTQLNLSCQSYTAGMFPFPILNLLFTYHTGEALRLPLYT